MWFVVFMIVFLVVLLVLGGLSEYSRRRQGDRPSRDASQKIEHKVGPDKYAKSKKKETDDDPMSQFDHLFEEQEDLWAKYDKKK